MQLQQKTKSTSALPWEVPAPRPKGDELTIMIPSSVIRSELSRTGRELTDLERAVLLDRSHAPWLEKMARLAALRDCTTDAVLGQHIQKLIASRSDLLRDFLNSDSGAALYRSVRVNSDGSESAGGWWRSPKEAWDEFGEETGRGTGIARIDRLPLLTGSDHPTGAVSMTFGNDGSFESLEGASDQEWETFTQANFAELPHPFRRGDIVCTADEKIHGVVETDGAYNPLARALWPPSAWGAQQAAFRIAVFDAETGLFCSTTAVQPEELEYYPAPERAMLDTMDGLLGILSRIYTRQGGIQELSAYTLAYRKVQGYQD